MYISPNNNKYNEKKPYYKVEILLVFSNLENGNEDDKSENKKSVHI